MQAQIREQGQRKEQTQLQLHCQDYSRIRMQARETRAVRMTFVSLLLAVVLISVLHTRFLSALYSIRDPVANNAVRQSSMSRSAAPRAVGFSTRMDIETGTGMATAVRVPLRVIRPRLCTIYDAPPGTGEFAISAALAACIRSKKHRVQATVARDASTAVRDLVLLNSTLVASVGRSFITSADTILLKTRCRHIIYVTSTATMRARLRDAAHAATNESADAATDWLVRRGRDAVRFYDAFPCVRINSYHSAYSNDSVIPDRFDAEEKIYGPALRPDFVVQREKLEEDLTVLLHAFGCESELSISDNDALIHAEAQSENSTLQAGEGGNLGTISGKNSISIEQVVREKVLSEILAIESSEKSHRRLVAMSRRVNEKGLDRITRLMNVIRNKHDNRTITS